jgi:tetratricopeptide (TPR) repeat protein
MRAYPMLAAALLAGGAMAAAAATTLHRAPRFDAAALAMLDPSRLAAEACAERARASTPVLLRRLQQAAALMGPVVPGKFPLYGGVPRSALEPGGLTAEARPWFDQGLEMAYNFNHAAAVASFRKAQALAPGCALCFWGEALVQGPNINAPMEAKALAPTLNALAKAQALAPSAPPLDRALITALAARYSADPKADRSAMDAAYADAMLGLAAAHPGNDEIAVLAAEAAMDTSPWNYWQPGTRQPRPRIDKAVALIEGVLARHPGHQEAAHLYIHLMEYVDPARAEKAADALGLSAMPEAGHLVHMPGHIYYRVGRFKDSIRANVAAAKSDEAYLARVPDDGFYRYSYYPHNVHFIVASAQQAGDLGLAVAQARKLLRIIPEGKAVELGWVQAVVAAPSFAFAQGGTPAQILALPRPDARLPYVLAMWHYARGVAYARLRQPAALDAELAAMDRLTADPGIKVLEGTGTPGTDLIHLAQHVMRGRMAYAQGDFAAAAEHYRKAQAIEGTIPYQEPPYWYYPVGQSLGAALLAGGKPTEARDAFHQALLVAPGNGWALWGLAKAERALGHDLEARAAEAALDRAWLGDRRLLTLERL